MTQMPRKVVAALEESMRAEFDRDTWQRDADQELDRHIKAACQGFAMHYRTLAVVTFDRVLCGDRRNAARQA